MKRALITLSVLVLAGSALAAGPKSATLTIRHEMKGCHSWSLDGKSWAASQKLTLTRGSTLAVVNDDVMPHRFVQVSGPKATLSHTAMTRIGAKALAGFAAKGRYVFTTKAGEDYMKGVKTTGEDNVLRLVVTVI